jgi:N-acetylglucosaminyldiphosphoundecaprenol N-acetyl-beta-D-mannosaminyltransferase
VTGVQTCALPISLANPTSEKLPHETPLRIFFFGGEGDAAEQAAANIQSISTGMEACGFLNPGMGSIESMSSEEITQQINDSQADFLLVALGAKKGQQWIMHNREKLNVPVISHLGAVVNFVAGNIDRAPDRWQKMGLEWLWRIVQEPGLFKRYFYDGGYFLYLLLSKVFPLVIYQYVLNKMPRVGPSIQITSDLIDNCLELGLQGSATRQNNRLLKTSCQKALDEPCTILKHVRINCAQLDYFDSAALGTLLLFKASLLEKGQTLSFYNVDTRIERLMSLHMVRDYLLN